MREKFALVVENTSKDLMEQEGRLLAALGAFSPRSFTLEDGQKEFAAKPNDYAIIIINDDATQNHAGRDWANCLAKTTTKLVLLISNDSHLRHYRKVIFVPKRMTREWLTRVIGLMHDLDN
jgi:hypothetical protein